MQPLPGKQDLAVNIIPVTPLRPGFATQYKIILKNPGTVTMATVIIQLIKSPRLTYKSATVAPTSINGDTLRWEFVDIEPFYVESLLVNFNVAAQPAVNVGDSLRTTATIFPVNGDVAPGDNVAALVQKVVGSYDPNDKIESHAGYLTTQQVFNADCLTYTIRFQNTGTDTAFNVYIRDTLNSKLDWSTLQIVSASNKYQLTINDDNKLSWVLNNINLTDSNRNEPASHGYITYNIKPKTTLLPGDTIKNAAAIYFDYNLPVATNTEKTVVQANVLPVKLVNFTAKRQAQNNLLQWTIIYQENLIMYEVERSINGNDYTTIGKVNATTGGNYTFTDARPINAINYYRLKIIDKDSRYTYSLVRSINNNASLDIRIYPNPAKDILSLRLDNDKNQSLQVEIIDMQGKAIMSDELSAEAGTSTKVINITTLQSGSYFIKLTSASNEQWLMKFQKL